MEYHIFETNTLNLMILDLNKEINKITEKLAKLNEQHELIQWIIKHRHKMSNMKIDDDTLIDPK